jgi:excisionase family DNA binding protein
MPRTNENVAARSRRFASLKDTADYLAVSELTIRRRLADGTFKAYRLGKVLRIDLAEVDTAIGAA